MLRDEYRKFPVVSDAASSIWEMSQSMAIVASVLSVAYVIAYLFVS